jgi:DNA polymerase-3 subunit delta'
VDGIIGHEAIRRELRTLALSDDPPHALLLAGPEGTGRAPLALEYARMLNCEARGQGTGDRGQGPPMAGFEDGTASPNDSPLPCGVCRSCRLIAERRHPDVIELGPGDTLCKPRAGESAHAPHPGSRDIRICQVRGLIELVARYPFEANYRAILIDPADHLGREASHTILKTLEEPPGHTVFALITAAPEAIIETVLSRCRRIDVRPVPRAEIESGLVARGVAPKLAAEAAAESRGRPGRAIAFASSPDLMGDRGRLLERCARVAGESTTQRFAYASDLAERWRRDRNVVAAELDAWEAFWEQQLQASAASGSERKDEARGIVEALRATELARADLQAQVMARAAFELMLLSFPRLTLAPDSEEEPATHAR